MLDTKYLDVVKWFMAQQTAASVLNTLVDTPSGLIPMSSQEAVTLFYNNKHDFSFVMAPYNIRKTAMHDGKRLVAAPPTAWSGSR